MKWKLTPISRLKEWISASIRRKLTFFVMLVCFMLIGLVFLLVVQLLQPAYNAVMYHELGKTLNTIVAVLNRADAAGISMTEEYELPGGRLVAFSDECVDLLNQEILNGNLDIENLCIDISDANRKNIYLWEQLPSRCILHKTEGLLGESIGDDGEVAKTLRGRVFSAGRMFYEQEQQMVMGRLAAGGKISVIVSVNLERVPQAVSVMQKLMLVVSVAMVALSALCAFLFSNWFTRPLTRLSDAAQEMAKGNYDVSVPAQGKDEIAELADDFNKMAQEVKRSNELQRDLLANVSHDLRTPLTLIKGYAETVRDLTGDDPERRTQQLDVIVDETDRLSALVGSVLELSRMSSGNEKIDRIRFDLTQLCDEVGYRYQLACEQKGLKFEFSGQPGCEVEADPAFIERALHNLLGNALKHVGQDGYIGLKVGYTPDGTRARVEVIDHGDGLPQDELELVFKRYYRSRTHSGKEGTGLGLSITKAIMDAHGYRLGVISAPGQGSTFWFEADLVPEAKE